MPATYWCDRWLPHHPFLRDNAADDDRVLIMMTCCPHPDSEHRLSTNCHELIHYPSEDYPCLCEKFEPGEDPDRCAGCRHEAAQHEKLRVCRPVSGELCPCRRA